MFEVWAMERNSADAQLPLLINALKGIAPTGDLKFHRENSLKMGFATEAQPYAISEYGEAVSPEKAPKDSIAIINLCDTIFKYDMECGPVGMKTKSNILQRCDANPNIKGMLLIIDSPGGQGTGAMLMHNTILSCKKPVVAFIDDMAASAGYYIASAADHVFANNNTSLIGSIGTYVTIVDDAAMLEKEGIKLHEIYADASIDKNQDFWKAIEYFQTEGKKGSLDAVKQLVNTFNEQFLSDVKANRLHALKGEDTQWNTGKLLFADEALKVGLIDGIDTLQNVISKFF